MDWSTTVVIFVWPPRSRVMAGSSSATALAMSTVLPLDALLMEMPIDDLPLVRVTAVSGAGTRPVTLGGRCSGGRRGGAHGRGVGRRDHEALDGVHGLRPGGDGDRVHETAGGDGAGSGGEVRLLDRGRDLHRRDAEAYDLRRLELDLQLHLL